MSDPPNLPSDRQPTSGSSAPGAGWRALGPGRWERRLRVEDRETRELFVHLLDRVARLSGLPGGPVASGERPAGRVRTAGVTLEGGRDAEGRVRPIDLVLQLELEPPEPPSR